MTLVALIVILARFATLALVVMLGIVLHNWLAFPRLKRDVNEHPNLGVRATGVSILVPARNEAHQIGVTVGALLKQAYPTFEVLVLDDHSDDNTGAIATNGAAGDPRFRLLAGQPLPTGWGGKNWACQQLAQAAHHGLLLFTDADVQWEPGALPALIQMQQQSNADLLTVWPTQVTMTWGERLVVPLMTFAVWAYLPVWLAHDTPYPAAAAANGQCLLFRRQAYTRCGGHMAVRGQVLDDVLLAQRVKATGGQLWMADGAGLIRCRMYQNWPEIINGYAKNILAGHNNSPLFLLLSTSFHLLIFVGPWLWLFTGYFATTPLWPFWPLLLIALAFTIRALTARATQQRIRDAFWMPISVLLMTRIAFHALWWHWNSGGPHWKGRTLPNG